MISTRLTVIGPIVFAALGVCGAACAAAAEAPRAAETANSLGMRFVVVPAGDFLMGSPADDDEAEEDERPRHRVRISRSYRLAVFETTQAEFRAVMGANPSWFCAAGGGRSEVGGVDTDKLPVDMVTWHEAEEFCRKLGELPAERAAGRTYRLPTEAEWEHACRAGTVTRYSTGDTLTAAQACILDTHVDVAQANLGPRPRGVGSFAANPFGLHDMHGNVWEWCADPYDAEAYRASPAVDPSGPEVGTGRVVRGGDYRFVAALARSANRDFTRATRRDQGNGFRVVLIVK